MYVGEAIDSESENHLNVLDVATESLVILLYYNDNGGDKTEGEVLLSPLKYANVSRFFSHEQKKPNLKATRVAIEGKAVLLLQALKKIKKGEEISWNYNGFSKNFPVEKFQ